MEFLYTLNLPLQLKEKYTKEKKKREIQELCALFLLLHSKYCKCVCKNIRVVFFISLFDHPLYKSCASKDYINPKKLKVILVELVCFKLEASHLWS